MAIKFDKGLIPVKAHFFFFFAALGPVLPQLQVYGRQLGISPRAMGAVTAVLPLLWATAKPLFGYLVDYFTSQRKLIFMLLIGVMTASYCGLWFIPPPRAAAERAFRTNRTVHLEHSSSSVPELSLERYTCRWRCDNSSRFQIWLPNAAAASVDRIDTVYLSDEVSNGSCSYLNMASSSNPDECIGKGDCALACWQEELVSNATVRIVASTSGQVSDASERTVASTGGQVSDVSGRTVASSSGLYTSAVFWWYVALICAGTVAFNVANCIGDAVCFDVLGPERGARYGGQRVYGTLGYGLTALLGGWLVDLVSASSASGYKDFTPAFALAAIFTCLDLVSCRALKLPRLSAPGAAGALGAVLRLPRVRVFVVFAVAAGALDSFIIYYMFWFLEELAEATGHQYQVKLIEGVVVAGQSFVGEGVFFALSGRIIRRFGFGPTMTASLACYALRLALVSFVTNPWQLVVIESIMQGPTYALCYACIVGYAARVAPAGYSATVQGVVAGMDDGLGFALGSLVGGQLYAAAGGRGAFRAMAAAAAAAGLAHAAARCWLGPEPDEEKTPSATAVVEEGMKMLPVEDNGNTIYKPTVVPLGQGDLV